MNTEAKNHSEKVSLVLLPVIRFAWLVGPEIFAIRGFHQAPVACILMCLGILAVWLSVDIGPFKAEDDSAPVAKTIAKARKMSAGRSLVQAAAKLVVFALLFQTRLMNF